MIIPRIAKAGVTTPLEVEEHLVVAEDSANRLFSAVSYCFSFKIVRKQITENSPSTKNEGHLVVTLMEHCSVV